MTRHTHQLFLSHHASSGVTPLNRVESLKDHFLIAMPSLDDTFFERAVIFLCEHSQEGAMGIGVTKPMGFDLGEIFSDLNIEVHNPYLAKTQVLAGGPIQPELGLVLHRPNGEWRSSYESDKGITVTSSLDVLDAMADEENPPDVIVTLGYSGWTAGQLEKELIENSWLVCPAAAEIIFDTLIEERWEKALSYLGIDPHYLSAEIGHA